MRKPMTFTLKMDEDEYVQLLNTVQHPSDRLMDLKEAAAFERLRENVLALQNDK